MKRIYKYRLAAEDVVRLEMPAFAKVLSAGQQDNEMFVWALVDPNMPPLPVTFRVAGTGHDIADDEHWDFVDTVHLYQGRLVFHVFQLQPRFEEPRHA